jgi:hypothetical protein
MNGKIIIRIQRNLNIGLINYQIINSKNFKNGDFYNWNNSIMKRVINLQIKI